MMGDGSIDLPRLRTWLEEAGYRGFHEVEVTSTRWEQRSPDETLSTARLRYELYC
jgi:sugar phosphate isomerase/epimerase